MHEKGVGEHIAQKTEPGHDRTERGGLGDDVGEFDFQHVARHRALDEHRPRQRVDDTRLDRGEVGGAHVRLDLAVERIAGFQRDLVALADFGNRLDVGMVAVVAAMRLVRQRL